MGNSNGHWSAEDDNSSSLFKRSASTSVPAQQPQPGSSKVQKYYSSDQKQTRNVRELIRPAIQNDFESTSSMPAACSGFTPPIKRHKSGATSTNPTTDHNWSSSLPEVSPREEEKETVDIYHSQLQGTSHKDYLKLSRDDTDVASSSNWSEQDDNNCYTKAVSWNNSLTNDDSMISEWPNNSKSTVEFGPITRAVIGKGLKAKFKSVSAWTVSPRSESISTSVSVPSGMKRWNSLKASIKSTWSVNGSLKLPRAGSWTRGLGSIRSKRTSQTGESIASDRQSTTSINSLGDGRTPWPIPWLDGLFLPDFPNRGPISEKNFTILGTIAKGAFGRVYRVCLKSEPDSIYAMKVQKKSEVISQDAVQQVKQEVSIHYHLCHSPFVAQLHYAWQNRTSLYMVLRYVTGYGDLYQLWRDEGPLTEEAVQLYAVELALGLDYIHQASVIYRDLKMENVMLDDNGHVQLVDFGLAKWLHVGDRTTTICGTLQYMAPEIITSTPYDHSVDYWSLGVLIHTLLTGQYPFTVGRDHTCFNIPSYIPPCHTSLNVQSLLSQLLRHDADLRFSSITELRLHPFFKNLDFDVVQEKQMAPFDLIPRMRRCETCNIEQDLDNVLCGVTNQFDEQYDMLNDFDFTAK